MSISGANLPDTCSNYYELLGICPFESDALVIEPKVRSLMREARKYQVGQYADQAEKCLNLLAAARTCLLDADQKQAYDTELRVQLGLPPASEGIVVLSHAGGETPAPQTENALPAAGSQPVGEQFPIATADDAPTPFPDEFADDAPLHATARVRTIAIVAAIAATIVAGVWFAITASRRPSSVELSEAEGEHESDADDADSEEDSDSGVASGRHVSTAPEEEIAVTFGTPGKRSGRSQANTATPDAARPAATGTRPGRLPSSTGKPGEPVRSPANVAQTRPSARATDRAMAMNTGDSMKPADGMKTGDGMKPPGQDIKPGDTTKPGEAAKPGDTPQKPASEATPPAKPPVTFTFDPIPKTDVKTSASGLTKDDILRELKAIRVGFFKIPPYRRASESQIWIRRAQDMARQGAQEFGDDPQFQKQLESEVARLRKMFPQLRESLKDLFDKN